ncbi:MAG: DUF131 domain-containing protein [Nitrososphaerota archaeon]|nr:DUF131 domain-containing protein [Candidatus Bathyarchaeota archaeon]MDW8194537.1 DUF131 domain-containing protein [Nitrososphaerota archaeon]
MDNASGERQVKWFLMLFLTGFFMVLAGMALLTFTAFSNGDSVGVGGIIFIGPIPIVFGAGPEPHWLIIIATVLGVICMVMMLLMKRAFWGKKAC